MAFEVFIRFYRTQRSFSLNAHDARSRLILVPFVPEVIEALTDEEAADRHRLELKVEKAFYQAAFALRELHERKLYRSTHSRFDHYCRDRFGFSQQNADLLIRAAEVIDNLKVTTIGCNFLPTSERQVRPLTKLNPDEQRQIWEEAVTEAGGRVPSGRIVKSIVERLQERNTTPPPISFQEGDVVLIRGLGIGNPQLRKYDGQWSIVIAVNEYTVTLAVDGLDVPVKPQFLEAVDPKDGAEIKAVYERITRLQQEEIDPIEDAGLKVLLRLTCFTPKQMMWLEWIENSYGIE